ncbi:hypothetical protein LCGC14_0587660 [marine sediment metagenome]|uniref:Uncharacterized protein n=1 Tax=marine sediment metagenome TaxID=412755 RepID=A0A0F9UMP2_9ZZZZ
MSGTDPSTSVPETKTIEGVIVIEDWKARAEKVERERDTAIRERDWWKLKCEEILLAVPDELAEQEAKLTAVEELVERWRKKGRTNVAMSWYARADEVEAALKEVGE